MTRVTLQNTQLLHQQLSSKYNDSGQHTPTATMLGSSHLQYKNKIGHAKNDLTCFSPMDKGQSPGTGSISTGSGAPWTSASARKDDAQWLYLFCSAVSNANWTYSILYPGHHEASSSQIGSLPQYQKGS